MPGTEATPGRTRSGRRSVGRAAAATGLLAFILPITVALLAQWLESDQWRWDDWAGLGTAILLGFLFFVLALIAGQVGNRRSHAVADAELISSMGALEMSSARSFAGSEQQILRIAADARAALQHYTNAHASQQAALIETIEDTYSDLVFGTFSRSDALTRSIWDQLRGGAEAVIKEAREVAERLDRKSHTQKEQLNRLADNVSFALSIGSQVRSQHQPSLQGAPIRLLCSWDGHQALNDETDAHSECDIIRRQRMHCLYRRELTVQKNWELLHLPSTSMACRVVLQDIAGTDEWYAPWYVTDRPPPLRPVNVLFDSLREAAANDIVVDRPGLERYPNAIRHGSIPRGMRAQAIANLREILRQRQIATVCVLVYDVIIDEHTKKRLVLDGNHRLAAARALTQERRSGWRRFRRSVGASDVRVLAFVLEERQRIDSLTNDLEASASASLSFPNWRGFSPDIGLLRGTWVAPRYEIAMRNADDWPPPPR